MAACAVGVSGSTSSPTASSKSPGGRDVSGGSGCMSLALIAPPGRYPRPLVAGRSPPRLATRPTTPPSASAPHPNTGSSRRGPTQSQPAGVRPTATMRGGWSTRRMRAISCSTVMRPPSLGDGCPSARRSASNNGAPGLCVLQENRGRMMHTRPGAVLVGGHRPGTACERRSSSRLDCAGRPQSKRHRSCRPLSRRLTRKFKTCARKRAPNLARQHEGPIFSDLSWPALGARRTYPRCASIHRPVTAAPRSDPRDHPRPETLAPECA